MSMQATFIQVDESELSKFEADPDLLESLFEEAGESPLPTAPTALTKAMQDRIRTVGPQLLAETLSRFDPAMRKQLEERLGRTASALATGEGGDAILKLMQERAARQPGPASSSGERTVLPLDKAWHGVHYVLCGEVEAGASLLSQAVLGGVKLGDDDEGFSGYGPPRYLTAPQVAGIAQALSRPELEREAAARFDAGHMSQLQIYPGWQPSDKEWVMDGFRLLRDFYSDAASKGRAMLTCLV